MARVARERGEFAVYHVITKGNDQKDIFLDVEDKEKYLEILSRVQIKYNFLVYAYCLMNNHLHLILFDNGNDISLIMKSLNISYVSYFNRKYKRGGHLFQGRYKSEIIDSNAYLLKLSKYVHNNPVKDGMVGDALEYKWSSFRQYVFGDFHDENDILSTSIILSLISADQVEAQQEYFDYVFNSQEIIKPKISSGFNSEEEEKRDYLSVLNEARVIIKRVANDHGLSVEALINNKKIRDETIRELREKTSLKLSEIGELLGGISESRVSRIARKR